MTKKKGLAIHCHHDALVEYCYDYNERVEFIETVKPENERPVRLELFKILPDEALKDLPKSLNKAYAEWKKADAEWDKACVELNKICTELWKAGADWQKAYDKWPQEARDTFHKKWCGCKYWNGKKLIFD
jgi:hypothetical protein